MMDHVTFYEEIKNTEGEIWLQGIYPDMDVLKDVNFNLAYNLLHYGGELPVEEMETKMLLKCIHIPYVMSVDKFKENYPEEAHYKEARA